MNAQPTTLAPPSPATLNLDEKASIEALCVQLRHSPQVPASLYIDCKQLRCQHTLGVSHVISQLLRLRQAGASIWLRNVNAPLRRCLQLLQLASLFHFVDSE
jgi:anti-anti-sigma regulatory factor